MSIFLKNSFFLRSLETRLLDWIDLLKSHRDCFRTIGFEVKIGGRGKGQELLTSYTLSFTVCDPSSPLWFPPLCGLCRSKHHGILSDVSCFSLSSLLLCPVDLPCSLLPDSPCSPPPPLYMCHFSKSFCNHDFRMLTENQGSLFRAMETPEPPSKGFFSSLFSSAASPLDREQLCKY